MAGLLTAAVVLLAPLAGSVAAAYAESGSTAVRGSSSSFASLTVTWNGQPISQAHQPSSAFSLSKGQTALILFAFTETTGGVIRNATVQLTYLGIVLTTSRAAVLPVTDAPPDLYGAGINWSFGPLYDALEGVFQFTASLLYANGSVAWSQTFFVFAKAPYLLESGAVVVLLVLAIAELYWGIAAIREARRGARPPTGPPAGSPPATPGGGSATPGPTTSSGAPPPEAPPPPAGGGGS